MTDPLNTSLGDRGYATDGGLNSSDTQDWADERATRRWRTLAVVILPAIFAALCLLALYLMWQKSVKPAATTAKPAAVATVDKDAQIAQLQSQILALQNQLGHPVPATATPAQPVYAADPTAVAQLSARMDRLEANQRAIAHAAAAVNAANALRQASHGASPFATELALVEPTLDNPRLIDPLRGYAEKGVPTEVTLAIEFPRVAARANIAAKADSGDDSLLNRAKHALGSFISVRRLDNVNGQGTEATLLRAETRLNAGDLNGAVANLATLSPSAQKAIKPWLDDAKARVTVDTTADRIAETALSHLGQAQADAAPGNGGAL